MSFSAHVGTGIACCFSLFEGEMDEGNMEVPAGGLNVREEGREGGVIGHEW